MPTGRADTESKAEGQNECSLPPAVSKSPTFEALFILSLTNCLSRENIWMQNSSFRWSIAPVNGCCLHPWWLRMLARIQTGTLLWTVRQTKHPYAFLAAYELFLTQHCMQLESNRYLPFGWRDSQFLPSMVTWPTDSFITFFSGLDGASIHRLKIIINPDTLLFKLQIFRLRKM